MGKINKDIEVIRLENSSKTSSLPNPKYKNMSAYDPSLMPRVQKYLEANINNQYVDVNLMAEELQRKYSKDYGKRKKSAFRIMVKKAYSLLMHAYGMGQRSSSEELSEESEGEERVPFNENSLNRELLEMYGRNMNPPKPIDENELIDISSDDSTDNMEVQKSKNGPSTSNKKISETHFMESILPPQPNLLQNMLKNNSLTMIPTITSMDRAKKRKNELPQQTKANTKKKRVSKSGTIEDPKLTFKDVGGVDTVLTEVCKLLVHIKHPEVYNQIGVTPPRGFLLHGPPGCGKTLLANAVAGELEVPLFQVSAPELVAGISGESEERIREIFERASLTAPCVLFIDEIDAITPNRQFAQKEMERRIVAQLLTCIDNLGKHEGGNQVLVIGATNRPDSLDPALRRAGRFDREVCLGIPDGPARLEILKVLTSKLRLKDDFDFADIVKNTPGYVGADLMALTREAAMVAVNRVFNDLKDKKKHERALAIEKMREEKIAQEKEDEAKQLEEHEEKEKPEADIIVDNDTEAKNDSPCPLEPTVVIIDDDIKQSEKLEIKILEAESKNSTPLDELISWLHNDAPLNVDQLETLFLTNEDFKKAVKCVQPSAKREGFATVPDVTWDEIGSLKTIREELQMAILAPVRHAEQFQSLGLTTPTGVLLCGPPGCGKTLLAKAVANEAGINFISVKGPELLNMYVGESERAVRVCFERARNSAPCVIFFDELDALCPKRLDSREGGATMRVVNQMLTEMDGVEERNGVYLLAATNRPDIVDPAVLRPGRLDKILYVGLPSNLDRVDILKTITKNGTKPLLAPNVDLEAIGSSSACDGYTGADLAALVREAAVQAISEVIAEGDFNKPVVVTNDHFTKAVSKIRPSVSDKDKAHYEKLKKIYSAKQPEVEEMEI